MLTQTYRVRSPRSTSLITLCFAPLIHAQTPIPGTSQAGPSSAALQQMLPPVSASRRTEAETAYVHGAKHMEKGEFAEAEHDFATAVQLNPAHAEYAAAMLVAREHTVTRLLQQAATQRPTDQARADQLIQQARSTDPGNPRVLQHDSANLSALSPSMRDESLAPVLTLKPNKGTHSYHQQADTKTLASMIAEDYGLKAAFDPDLAARRVRIDVDDVSADEAMQVLTLLTGTMYVPLSEHSFLLALNTAENRQRYERLVEKTFDLPGYQADQLKDFVSIAQQLLDIRQISTGPLSGKLVVRGPAERVDAFQRVFDDLLEGNSEVVLDLKLYSVDKSHVRNLGVVLPQSLNFFSLAAEAQNVISQNSTLISQLIASGVIPANASKLAIAAYLVFVAGLGNSSLLQNSFLLLGGGLTTAAVSAGNVPTINLALTQSEARDLEDVQLRASDQQKAVFRSGTRYPIQTSLFSDIASSTATSLTGATVNGVSLSSLLASYLGTSSINSRAVIPQVQYEDLGLTLTATTRVQLTSDITMRLEVKVSALAGTALNGIPVLNSRQFSSDLTVHDGETVLMVSNATRSETAAVSGLPGLSEVPGFQSTTNRNTNESDGTLVLLITPHIVRHSHLRSAGPMLRLTPRPGED